MHHPRTFATLLFAAAYGGCLLPSVSEGEREQGAKVSPIDALDADQIRGSERSKPTDPIEMASANTEPDRGSRDAAEIGPDGGANELGTDSTPGSCTCMASDLCCDGCHQRLDSCMIDGVCYPNGTEQPGNSCQYCDVALDRTAWTAQEEGASCDNLIYCDGVEHCGGGARKGRCISSGDPCLAGGDQCLRCDERTRECGLSADVVWTDPRTKLLWKRYAEGGRGRTWEAAQTDCQSLNFCGRDDWRLPTIGELRTLVQNCPPTETDGACAVTDTCTQDACRNEACDGCDSGMHIPDVLGGFWQLTWSSTETAAPPTALRWTVDFNTAKVEAFSELGLYQGRCVTTAR